MNYSKRDYVDVIHNENNKPLTSYQTQLAFYLFNKYKLQPFLRNHSKWVRFSKEIMLLSIAYKSKNELF